MYSGLDLGVNVPSEKWVSSLGGEEVVHVGPVIPHLPVHSSLDVLSSEFPCLHSEGSKDPSIGFGEAGPLVVRSLTIEGVVWAWHGCGVMGSFSLWFSGEGVHSIVGGIGVAVLIGEVTSWEGDAVSGEVEISR